MNADRLSLASLTALGPRQAASLWLERLQRDGAGADDELFREWLGASEANRVAWADARELWDNLGEPDEDDVLRSMRQEALAFPPRRAVPAWFRYAGAASLAVLVSTAAILTFNRSGQQPVAQVAGTRTDPGYFGAPDYVTAVGQRSSVSLDDGTKVTLDTNSAVDIAYAGGLRLVRLVRGQAFFDVAHDPSHPFRVAAGGRVVTALGTRFNIRMLGGETRILLEQGSVAVSRSEDPSRVDGDAVERLAPGQELTVRLSQSDKITNVDVRREADWRRGLVRFDGDRLSAAVAELNRYSETQLVIRDPRVASLHISGAFPTGDTARFAQALTALYPVRVVAAGSGKLEIVRQP